MNSDSILLVEDNEDDIFFMKQALKEADITNPLHTLDDGQQVIDYLGGVGVYADREKYPLPTIVFLDLKLPVKNGHEVLKWIRAQPQFAKLIVIVMTASNEPVDMDRCYRLGANSFVVKPATSAQLLALVEAFKLWWLRQNRVMS